MSGRRNDNARGHAGVEGAAVTTDAIIIAEAPEIVKPRAAARDLFPDTLPALPLPIFPTPGSIKERALLALIAGPVRQSGFRHSWRLAAYVGFLLEDGWAVRSRDVVEDGRTVAEYTLDRSDEPTRTAAERYRRRLQSGHVDATVAGWLAVAVVVLALAAQGVL